MIVSEGAVDAVLVVHAERRLRQILDASLRCEGFHVVEAAEVASAIRCLQGLPGAIDWLIVDLDAPGPCRVEHVVHEYRFFHPLRPVVATTGRAIDHAVRRMTELSVFRCDDAIAARIGSYMSELRQLKAELTY